MSLQDVLSLKPEEDYSQLREAGVRQLLADFEAVNPGHLQQAAQIMETASTERSDDTEQLPIIRKSKASGRPT